MNKLLDRLFHALSLCYLTICALDVHNGNLKESFICLGLGIGFSILREYYEED